MRLIPPIKSKKVSEFFNDYCSYICFVNRWISIFSEYPLYMGSTSEKISSQLRLNLSGGKIALLSILPHNSYTKQVRENWEPVGIIIFLNYACILEIEGMLNLYKYCHSCFLVPWSRQLSKSFQLKGGLPC